MTPDSAHLVRDEARAAAGERGDIERDMDGLLLLVRGEVKGETCSWTRSKSWETGWSWTLVRGMFTLRDIAHKKKHLRVYSSFSYDKKGDW